MFGNSVMQTFESLIFCYVDVVIAFDSETSYFILY